MMGSTMGSAKEFEESIRFVEKHRIVPVVKRCWRDWKGPRGDSSCWLKR